MKINVYKNREIEKTYEAENYDLMFGTVEDIMTIFDIDALKTGSDVELINLVTKALPSCLNIINPLLKDIFEGLTDEELKRVKLKEVAIVLVDVIKYTLTEISKGFGVKK